MFATLSGAGSDLLSELNRPFDAMLIDEAAQCVELSTLVALRHGVKHVILVGDPRQLPATVFMRSEHARLYERSLFERLENAGHRVLTLDTQYRMHPEVSMFPSSHFYQAKLRNGDNVVTSQYNKIFHGSTHFKPFLFFDTRLAHASSSSDSDRGDGKAPNGHNSRYRRRQDMNSNRGRGGRNLNRASGQRMDVESGSLK